MDYVILKAWVMTAENLALPTQINFILKYIKIVNIYFKL